MVRQTIVAVCCVLFIIRTPSAQINRPVIFPAEKNILLTLDTGSNVVYIGVNGTGGPLTVTDDSPMLNRGVATVSVLRSGVRETYPNDYGLCECNNTFCKDVFELCGTSFSLQVDLFAGAFSAAGENGPVSSNVPTFVVYSFNGLNTQSNNWLELASITKSSFLQVTDDFTVSFWIRISTVNSAASYILACELGTNRYFSLYDASTTRMIWYYFRGTLPGVTSDDGYNSQVTVSFYYDPAVFPNGLRDNQWHFITLTINYPSVSLSVDRRVYMPTQGNYRNQFDSSVILDRLLDGTTYFMPAPILTKLATEIDQISCKLGGSARDNRFSLFGEIRQPMVTNILTDSEHRCIASCNEYLDVDLSFPITQSFQTFYDPVKRILEFNSPAGDSQYSTFLKSLIFVTNGFIPPQEEGESRQIDIQIADEVGFGNIALVTIINITTESTNQQPPVCDPSNVSVQVRDDTLIGSVIHTLRATDDDIGIDGDIFYTMVVGNASLFAVNTVSDGAEQNGEVILLGALCSEAGDSYHIVVNVCDFGAQQLCCSSDILISIEVTDVNTNRLPELDLDSTSDGVNFTTVFSPDSGPVTLLNRAVLLDRDNLNMQELEVTLIGGIGPQEVLSINRNLLVNDTQLSHSYSFPVLTVEGLANILIYNNIIGSVTYTNVDITMSCDRQIQFIVTDAANGRSKPAFVNVNLSITPESLNSGTAMLVSSNLVTYECVNFMEGFNGNDKRIQATYDSSTCTYSVPQCSVFTWFFAVIAIMTFLIIFAVITGFGASGIYCYKCRKSMRSQPSSVQSPTSDGPVYEEPDVFLTDHVVTGNLAYRHVQPQLGRCRSRQTGTTEGQPDAHPTTEMTQIAPVYEDIEDFNRDPDTTENAAYGEFEPVNFNRDPDITGNVAYEEPVNFNRDPDTTGNVAYGEPVNFNRDPDTTGNVAYGEPVNFNRDPDTTGNVAYGEPVNFNRDPDTTGNVQNQPLHSTQ